MRWQECESRDERTVAAGTEMGADEQILKEKALLLITRERELFALRYKHQRLLNWLTLSQSLTQVVRRDWSLAEIGAKFVARIITLIKLQRVQLFEIRSEGTSVFGTGTCSLPALPESIASWLARTPSGLSNEPQTAEEQAIASLLHVQRVLWCCVDALPNTTVVLVGGFDAQRAACYPPFDQEDAEHFAHAGQHFGSLLRNVLLVNELEEDKMRLERFNAELERRVQERTEDLARANEDISRALLALREKDRRLNEDLLQARAFQQGILPTLPRSTWAEFGVVYRPLDLVGGDIYDITLVEEKRFRVFVADATGHGVQASLRTILIKSEYDRIKQAHSSPATLLAELNRHLVESYASGEMLCTACCFDLIAHERGSTLLYSNAAHPGLMVGSPSNMVDLYHDGPFLGLSSDVPYEVQEVPLAPGDIVTAFTDGFSDQPDSSGNQLDVKEVLERMFAIERSVPESLEALVQAFDSFRGEAPTNDDVTILTARLVTRREARLLECAASEFDT